MFVAVLIGLCFAVYSSGKRIDYTWRWDRVTPYIINTDPVSIDAEYTGSVEVSADETQLILTPDGGEDPIVITDFNVLSVSDGDLVFEGDTLAEQHGWQIGPIVEGLIVTIEISFYSLVIALVLGLVIGLMRISDNPAARKLAIVYIEVIRGTPLLVQIFIMYFFIGTVLGLDRFYLWCGGAIGIYRGLCCRDYSLRYSVHSSGPDGSGTLAGYELPKSDDLRDPAAGIQTHAAAAGRAVHQPD